MIRTGRRTIGTTPTLISAADLSGRSVLIFNSSLSHPVFLDGENVSITTGFELAKQTSVHIGLSPTDKLYGISELGNVVISFMETDRLS